MLHVLETHFHCRKSWGRMVDHLERRFQVRKGCVMMVHISCTRFDIWNGLLRMVDVWYTRFDMQRSEDGIDVEKRISTSAMGGRNAV